MLLNSSDTNNALHSSAEGTDRTGASLSAASNRVLTGGVFPLALGTTSCIRIRELTTDIRGQRRYGTANGEAEA